MLRKESIPTVIDLHWQRSKSKSNNFISQTQQYKVNDTTEVQHEKIQKKHTWVYLLLYNKTAQIRQREGNSPK